MTINLKARDILDMIFEVLDLVVAIGFGVVFLAVVLRWWFFTSPFLPAKRWPITQARGGSTARRAADVSCGTYNARDRLAHATPSKPAGPYRSPGREIRERNSSGGAPQVRSG